MSDEWDRSTRDLPGAPRESAPTSIPNVPTRIGRYEVVEAIAGGGMGLVYAASDPELARKVALKVVHPRRGSTRDSHGRLIQEARALAQLDHPNVVKVHDVLAHDGEIVIVMELLVGETLAAWEVASSRTWREVVSAYLQAGEGLAAAHELDIVHCDFKPSNAMIGPEGRVRVLDFGIARLTIDIPSDDGGEPQSSAVITRTVSGVFAGTPAYASPEQLEGRAVTAASDQFSFCVALHRALEGTSPFSGESVEELAAGIRAQTPALATDSRRIPAWLRRLVRRGLLCDPSDRYPSMKALLAELRRPRGWRRWRLPTLAAVFVMVAALVALRSRAGADDQPCDGGATTIATLWNNQQKEMLRSALARAGTPYANEVVGRVLGGIDAYLGSWSNVHRAACTGHRRGEVSDLAFERQMACLRQRRDELAESISVLQGTPPEQGDAISVVAKLTHPTTCADIVRLLRSNGNDPAPEKSANVRALVSKAAALAHSGRVEEAERVIVTAIARARETAYPPLLAEAELEDGRILIAETDYARAAPVLLDAMQIALSAHLESLAVEAGARRIWAEGVESPELVRLSRDLAFIEPISQAVLDDHFVQALLLNNVGVVYRAARHPDEALDYFKRARDEEAREREPDVELTSVELNLGMLSKDASLRTQALDGALARLRSVLGEHHPNTLQAELIRAIFSSDAAEALRRTTAVCRSYREYHPTLAEPGIQCERARAIFANEAEDPAAAEDANNKIVADTEHASDPEMVVWGQLAHAALDQLHRSPAKEVHELEQAAASYSARSQWWLQLVGYQAELELGRIASTARRYDEARAHLRRAAHGFTEVCRTENSLQCASLLAQATRTMDAIPR